VPTAKQSGRALRFRVRQRSADERHALGGIGGKRSNDLLFLAASIELVSASCAHESRGRSAGSDRNAVYCKSPKPRQGRETYLAQAAKPVNSREPNNPRYDPAMGLEQDVQWIAPLAARRRYAKS